MYEPISMAEDEEAEEVYEDITTARKQEKSRYTIRRLQRQNYQKRLGRYK